MKNKLAARNNKIFNQYMDGMTFHELHDEYGLSVRMIRRIVKRAIRAEAKAIKE